MTETRFLGDRLVASVVDHRVFQDFLSWQQQRQKSSIADAFADLRNLCAEEDYLLEIPQRENREFIS
ncbi:prevent-host-death protein [Planktothricoides raciborskii]|uniref:Prevent-host-death protein n=1 Tax=Planktothricoides raciborskii GIHE-MW2 TaxID=2792601 RepID=A0AAU8JHH4_9CYAN